MARRDGARADGENAWANIGERRYQIEYPAWGLLSRDEHPKLTYFYVAGGGADAQPPLPGAHDLVHDMEPELELAPDKEIQPAWEDAFVEDNDI
jgi:hypothetical protein